MTAGDRPTASFGRRLMRAVRNVLILTLVLGLSGAALYAVSLLNARTYTLEVKNGQLVVMKGRLMPTGADPWVPSDARLVDTYAPLDLEGNTPLGGTQTKFSERDELDRALFGVIEMLAKPRVASDSPKDLEKGLYYVRRAERLAGLSDEQKLSLQHLQADVSFYLARTRLEDAQRQIDEALTQLKVAAQSENRHARAANQMLLVMEGPSKTLSDALRTAVHSLSAPAGSPELPPVALPPPPPPPVAAGADAGS